MSSALASLLPDPEEPAPALAERVARERAERLYAVTAALSRAMTPAEVYAAVLEYGVVSLESEREQGQATRSSSLYMLAGDMLELVGWDGFEPRLLALYRRVPLAAPIPISEAVRECRPIWLRSKLDYAAQYPHLAEQIQLLETESAVSMPVVFAGRAMGVLSFTFVRPRAFDADERRFLLALSDQAAQALERSRLFVSLRDSEEQLRSVFTSIEEGFSIIELCFDAEDRPVDFRYLQANPAFERLTGLRDVIGHTARELMPAFDPRFVATYAEVALTGATAHFETDTRVPGRWLEIYATRVGDAASRRVAVTINDITERKRAEQALREREAQLRGLARTAVKLSAARDLPAILELVTEEARSLIRAHQAVTSLTTGEDWGQAITALAFSAKYEHWRTYVKSPDGSGIYALVCRRNQPLRLTQAELEAHPAWRGFGDEAANHPPLRGWLAAPLMGRDGRNLGLIQLSDKEEGEFSADDEAILVQFAQLASRALEQQQLYEEEQRARAAAEQAVRLREQFLSIASHELRTPLTSVVAHAQAFQQRALRDGALGERDLRSLAQILGHAGRLNRMISAMLDVSRIDQGRLKLELAPLDLNAFVREVVAGHQVTSPRHRLQLAGADTPLWIEADALRLEQVLQNLLSNAIKYSPWGGTVYVTVGGDEAAVWVTVRDHGIGIPAEDLPYIFERFYRARNVSADTITGVGIGLFVVQEIVALHSGKLTVESEVKEGSSFTVTLPRAAR